ncbi:MAG TPA: TonB-dependent receptor [Steroidobacteraceae bacterium]|nr:TonB-dependent receptor [Steroidobacteraceae bacterium]
MKKFAVHSAQAAACAASMFAVPAVLAQDAPVATNAAGLEEVTVTARRREENLQDVPIAITAFTGEALELRGSTDIGELTQSVPSVTFEPSRATNSTLTAFIRGVGQQDPLAGFEQGVALYIDDVYVARPQGSLLDIYDVDRIEVLRGPQGTLYGRNAVGGAIKYVTRRLAEDPTLRMKAAYGSYNQVDLVGTGSLPLGDLFRVGATVASLTRDGYGENRTTGQEQYNKDVLAYRVSAEFEPNDDLLFRLSYDNTNDKSDPVAGWRPFPGARSGDPVLGDVRDSLAGAADAPSTAYTGGNNEVEAEGVHLSIDWEINDAWTVRSITAYREDYTESVIDFDSLEVMDFDGVVIYDNDQKSQELQFLYSGERVNAVAGMYYLDATAANDFDIVLGQTIAVPLTSYTGGVVDTEAWSLFADVTFDMTDTLALSLGGRYTEDKRTADVFRALYVGVGSPFFGGEQPAPFRVDSDYEAERTFEDFSPRINLTYQPDPDTTLYVGYSQGFKAGSFDPRGANFVTPEVEKGFEPETLDSYEMGMKSVLFDGRATANVALFYSDYQDMQIPGSAAVDRDGDGVNESFIGTVTNAAQSTISGVEFEGNFLVTEAFSVQVALSALDAEIDEWIFNGEDVSNQRFIQNTPETMAYLGLTYRAALAGGTLGLNANASYRDEVVQFEEAYSYIDQDAVTLYNASVTWESDSGHWVVGVHGKNLSDEDVKTAGYCFGFDCRAVLGVENNVSVFYGPPLTVTGTVEYRF